MKFSEIEFGMASGESEAVTYPYLVKDGFIDNDNIINKIIQGNKYLILGYKGSGKSLIGEKLLSMAAEREDFICEKKLLGDFPFASFEKILPKNGEDNNNYPKTWDFVILTALVNMLIIKNISFSSEWMEFVEWLRDNGLLSGGDFRSIVAKASRKSFHINICKFMYKYENENDYVNNFDAMLTMLRRILKEYNPDKCNMIVIDGLDEFLSLKKIQNLSLGSLLYSVGNLCNYFFREKLNYKIVLLIRTDLFEKFEIPNKNKQCQDFAIRINWYHDSREPQNSNLIKLANIRANLKDKNCGNIFERYFPKKIGTKDVIPYLLENTRHTPRDFIQLLASLQKFSVNEVLSKDEILSGLKCYSEDYFLPEIKDEMNGYISSDKFDFFLACLGSFRDREISSHKLIAKCTERMEKEDVIKILRALFECSAIGNKFKGMVSDNRYCFRFRNRNCTFNPEETIVIHQGLLKALGIK